MYKIFVKQPDIWETTRHPDYIPKTVHFDPTILIFIRGQKSHQEDFCMTFWKLFFVNPNLNLYTPQKSNSRHPWIMVGWKTILPFLLGRHRVGPDSWGQRFPEEEISSNAGAVEFAQAKKRRFLPKEIKICNRNICFVAICEGYHLIC